MEQSTRGNYTITLTAAELDLIALALAEMPYRVVCDLIAKLRQQLLVDSAPLVEQVDES